MLRTAFRTSSAPLRRSFATAAPASAPSTAGSSAAEAFVKEREAIKHHAASSASLWKKITYFVAFPVIVAGYLNAESMAEEHHKHIEHVKEENGGQMPDRIKYPYFTKRDKAFPWSSNETLFFNPEVNFGANDAEE